MELMNRTQWAALGSIVVFIAVTGLAYGLTGTSDVAAVEPSTTTTTLYRPPTTVLTTTTTTAPDTTTTTEPKVDGLVKGAEGEDVAAVQRRLTELRFDPGPADGSFGQATVYAVQAFQKLQGMEPTGEITAAVQAALSAPEQATPMVPGGGSNRVEIDLVRQLLFVYQGDNLRLISHTSTGSKKRYCADGGCGTAITPVGAHRFLWRYPGWRTSRLGKLYNPVYFTGGGIAIHGATSVPTYPASHGCVRIPMHIAEYFPSLVAKGDPVYVLDGKTDVGPAPALPTEVGPPPADPPTTPDTVADQPPPTVPSTTTTPVTVPTTSVPTTPTTLTPAPTQSVPQGFPFTTPSN